MRLSVNIDHVATLRQARRGRDPDPVSAAFLAELAGAHGITVHLRGDRRHIQERDLYLLRETMRTRLNVEVAVAPEALKVMREVKPDQVTLVPERPDEITTEGGLDMAGRFNEVEEYVRLYHEAGTEVSLFINPDPDSVRLAGKLGPEFVEFNTAEFGGAADAKSRGAALKRLAGAAKLATRLKLEVHVGHDINYRNAAELAAEVDGITEASIGHAIMARSVFVGMERAVKEMLVLLNSVRTGR